MVPDELQGIISERNLGGKGGLAEEAPDGGGGKFGQGNRQASMEYRPHDVDENRAFRKEQKIRSLFCIRTFVDIFLFISAILVGVGVYTYTRNTEWYYFELHFYGSANRVVESFTNRLARKLQALDGFAVSLTSVAHAMEWNFPNVTLPDFETRGATTRIQADGINLYWMPYITDATRAEWEEYAETNHGWMEESFRREQGLRTAQDHRFGIPTGYSLDHHSDGGHEHTDGNVRRKRRQAQAKQQQPQPRSGKQRQLHLHDEYHPYIFNTTGYPMPQGSGPYLPLWQMSPTLPMLNVLNFNMLTHELVGHATWDALRSNKAVISQVHSWRDPPDDPDDSSDRPDNSSVYDTFLWLGQYRNQTDALRDDPISTMIYPVFNGPLEQRQLVGMLQMSFYWKLFFTDILSSTTDGLSAVLASDCENSRQTFTYRVESSGITFLGSGDRHERKYDSIYVHSANVISNFTSQAGAHNQAYTAVDLYSDHCIYNLTVYPSDAMGDYYITVAPVWFTFFAVMIFIGVSLVFIIYECMMDANHHDIASRRGGLLSVANLSGAREAVMRELSTEDYETERFEDSQAFVSPGQQKSMKSMRWSAGTDQTRSFRSTEGSNEPPSENDGSNNAGGGPRPPPPPIQKGRSTRLRAAGSTESGMHPKSRGDLNYNKSRRRLSVTKYNEIPNSHGDRLADMRAKSMAKITQFMDDSESSNASHKKRWSVVKKTSLPNETTTGLANQRPPVPAPKRHSYRPSRSPPPPPSSLGPPGRSTRQVRKQSMLDNHDLYRLSEGDLDAEDTTQSENK